MAPVTFLYRLVWSGRLFEAEGWSCSIHINSNDAAVATPDLFEPALSTWMTTGGARISSAAVLDEIKFNRIAPTTGRYFEAGVSHTHVTSGIAGTGGATAPQLSQAISTRTALTRGRGHAGRFYPPSGQLTLGSDGRTTALVAQDAANAAAILLDAVNAVVTGPGGQVVIFSKIAQTVTPVTAVRVGRVVDTMRSRRTSLDEDPQTAPLA